VTGGAQNNFVGKLRADHRLQAEAIFVEASCKKPSYYQDDICCTATLLAYAIRQRGILLEYLWKCLTQKRMVPILIMKLIFKRSRL